MGTLLLFLGPENKVSIGLRKAGYVVLATEDPQEAWFLLKKSQVSVCIAPYTPTYVAFFEELKKEHPLIERVLLTDSPSHQLPISHIKPLRILSPESLEEIMECIEDRSEHFHLKRERQALEERLRSHSHELYEAQKQRSSDHTLGLKMHQALLIDPAPTHLPGVAVTVCTHPSEEMGGDFIAFQRPLEHVVDIAMGDVMGKGLPSAMVAAAVKSQLSHFADASTSLTHHYDASTAWHDEICSIEERLERVEHALSNRLIALDYFVCLFYARLDLRQRTLSFVDCGFTKPLCYRKEIGRAILTSASHLPLGLTPKNFYRPHHMHYQLGDFFVFYSNGVTQARAPSGELFGNHRLCELVEKHNQLSPQQLGDEIHQAIRQFTQKSELEDDCMLVIIRIDALTAPAASPKGIAKFNSVLSQLEAVRLFTKELCAKTPGNPEALTAQMQLIIDEIFTNIIFHSYEGKAGCPICIHADYLEDHLVVEISDQGRPFHPGDTPEINLFGDREHGYGWYLIRKIADKVQYRPKQTQNGWNRLKLYKKYCHTEDMMELNCHEQNGALIIRLDFAHLDAKQVPEFKERAQRLIEQHQAHFVVFDLQKLQFIDSSGLGAFLSLFRQITSRSGKMALVSMTPSVKTIFELVSMQKIFPCFPSIDSALSVNV